MQRPQKMLGKLKSGLLITTLALSGCAGLPWLPPAPEYFQCAYHHDFEPPGFYCVKKNGKSKEQEFRPLNSPQMKGAQCVDVGDYAKGDKWIVDAKNEARKRCK